MPETERNFTINPPGRDPLLGRVLAGRYEITGLLGEGGMGRVYQGRQRTLDRPVAIKCVHPHLLSSETVVVRFLEEARVASQLVHPNIVKIYDFGRTVAPEPPTLFLVMELLTGPDLGSAIAAGGPLPLVRVRSIMLQVLSALGEAHARGVTHRDAKPDNVILEPTVSGCERAKLIDFGIAKVHGAPGVTAVGQFIGTPCYMPPEQIRGERTEVSADLYSAGVTLFQMITGRLPFQGGSLMAVLEQQLYAKRPDPREVAPEVQCPASLAAVCIRAIDADPKNRYETADLFAEALEESFAEVLPLESRRSPYPAPPRSSKLRETPPPGEEAQRPSSAPPPLNELQRPSAAPPPLNESQRPSSAPPRREAERGRRSSAPPVDPFLDGIDGAAGAFGGTSHIPRASRIPLPLPASERGADLGVAEAIERTADAALSEGNLERAENVLRAGLELGQAWLVAGEREAAGAAVRVFGRKLGVVMRRLGHLEGSEEALKTALEYADEYDCGRARVLVELVATLGDAGRVTEAEAYRLEALRIATRHSERELTARLRRQAQSLALALATGASAPPGPTAESSSPRRGRLSDFRIKVEPELHEASERASRRR
jgi:serine/threonine protein kinase